MANRVPQVRHTFWRSGTSSMESPQQRRLPTGRTRHSVAQLTATASDIHGGSEVVTRVRRFSPDPHLCPASSAYTTATIARRQAVDADGPMDAQTRPQVLAKPR